MADERTEKQKVRKRTIIRRIYKSKSNAIIKSN